MSVSGTLLEEGNGELELEQERMRNDTTNLISLDTPPLPPADQCPAPAVMRNALRCFTGIARQFRHEKVLLPR